MADAKSTTDLTEAVEATKLKAALAVELGREITRRFIDARIKTYCLIHTCDCGGVSLLLDLTETRGRKSLATRIATKFAKRRKLHFSTDMTRCAACGERHPGQHLKREIVVSETGRVAKDELKFHSGLFSKD